MQRYALRDLEAQVSMNVSGICAGGNESEQASEQGHMDRFSGMHEEASGPTWRGRGPIAMPEATTYL